MILIFSSADNLWRSLVMKTWKPALQFIIETVVKFAMLNKSIVSGLYVLPELKDIQFNVEVSENYALLEDEEEEKAADISEINANARSRKSYIKKWRREEFKTDEQIDDELMQIALENNMFDSLSMNTQIQGELEKIGTEQQVEKNVQQIETQTKFEEE